MKPSEIVGKMRDVSVAVLWRQWRSLGAMTNTGAAQTIVDPEALLLASMSLEELEPRVRGVLESWVWENSRLISVQRLRSLVVGFPGTEDQLPQLAALAVGAGDERWQTFQSPAKSAAAAQPKTRAAEVRVTYSGALVLQLRSGFGVGVRADVLSYLLGVSTGNGGWAAATNIARALSYTATAVRQVADEMARADFIEPIVRASEGRGRGAKMYRARQSAWQALAPSSGQRWAYWAESLQMASGVHFWARNLGDANLGEFALRTFLVDFMAKHRGALWRPGEEISPVPSESEQWWEYIGERVTVWRDWAMNNS